MAKKIVFSVLSILLVLLLIFAILYFVPSTTSINQKLDCVEVDANGNPIGSAEFTVQLSERKYLFLEDTFDFHLTPHGNLSSIILATDNDGNVSSTQVTDDGVRQITFMVYDTSGNSGWGIVSYTKDYDCWGFTITIDGTESYYVASLDGSYTTQQIIQRFQGLIPGYKHD